jgi:hypothetical protein
MGVPQIVLDIRQANADSSFYITNPNCANCYPNQAARGTSLLISDYQRIHNYTGSDGYHFVAGTDWFTWVDKNNELANYGVVTLNDNIYGYPPACPTKKEDAASSITDCFGFTTTAEPIAFGNFAQNGVVCANSIWLGNHCADQGVSSRRGHLP